MPSALAGKSGLGPWNGTYVGSGAAPLAGTDDPAGRDGVVGAHAAANETASAPPEARRNPRRLKLLVRKAA